MYKRIVTKIKSSELIQNLFWRALQTFGKQGVNFIIFIMCAKLLIPYEFGIYNYVLAAILSLVIFGDFGISTATSKYVSQYNVTDKEKLKGVLFNSALVVLILCAAVFIALIFLGKSYFNDKWNYILWALPLIFFAPLTSLYDGIYRGLKKNKLLSMISIGVGIVSIIISYILIKHLGLVGALLSQSIFYGLLLLCLAIFYKEFHFKLNKEVIKEIGSYSFILGIISVGYLLYSRVDLLILGHFGYVTEVGYYELVNKIIFLLLIPTTILAQVQAPNIVSEFYQDKKLAVFKKLKSYIAYSFVFSIICSIVVSLVVSYLLKSFLSEYYNPIVLGILNLYLIIFIFQNVADLIGNAFIVSTGHAKLNMINIIIFGILNFLLGVIFVKYYGFIGISYAKIIVLTTGSISLIWLYYRTIKKDLDKINYQE